MARAVNRRFLGGSRAFATVALQMVRVPFWLLLKPGSPVARRQERLFFTGIVAGFGLRVRVRGAVARPEPVLFVVNHISWADIPVLATALDADFVAKADIAGWPVLGWLARRYDPVFVERGRSHRSGDQAADIRRRLEGGRSIILFAEGTTSDGRGVLPFRSALFAVADAAAQVQPVALRYLAADGSALDPGRQRDVAWIGDDALLPGAVRVAREKTEVLVQLLDPVEPQAMPDRKALAAFTRQAIADAYAAAPNLPR